VQAEPIEPDVWHVWVHGRGEHGVVQPGIALRWQYLPLRNVTQSAWSALVLTSPSPEAVLVRWVNVTS
jgi:hypothetical protein